MLSARHVGETGARSLDILHVAAALELGVEAFASLDERQRAVAHRAGLKLFSPSRNASPLAKDPLLMDEDALGREGGLRLV